MRSRFLLAVALLLGVSTVTSAQVTGTVMPSPKFEAFNALGTAPCASCRLHAYVAGTTNNQDTYSDVTLATPNANPIVLDSAGRATVFLSANSYKFVLKDANDSATIWTQDNISATASFSVATDITGTAGEALSAGQVTYLSDGSGGLVAGRWYLADADFTYASSAAAAIGITPAAITSGSAGAIRITGRSTNLVGLVSGTTYYVSATAGSLTSTSPANSRVVGVADSTTSLVQSSSVTNLALLNAANVFTNATGQQMRKVLLSGSTSGTVTVTVPAIAGANTLTLPAGTTDFSATGGTRQLVQQTAAGGALTVGALTASHLADAVAPSTSGNLLTSNGSTWTSASGAASRGCDLRLTLTTGVPVTTSDVTAATTLYATPYVGQGGGPAFCALYDGSTTWNGRAFTEISIAVPATTSTMYDVWVYDNSGTPTLEVLAWTNDTTRATALTTQNGVLVKTGATTRRYVGSFRTTTVSGQTEDSAAKRYVWNYYNRVIRPLRVLEATASWNYTVLTWRQARATATNQVDIVVGWAEDAIDIDVVVVIQNGTALVQAAVGIGEDSTTAVSANALTGVAVSAVSNAVTSVAAHLRTIPAVGRHFYVWLEESVATGTTTWFGTGGLGAPNQSGMSALWRS